MLADGSWLLVWCAFDGEDDELVWRATATGRQLGRRPRLGRQRRARHHAPAPRHPGRRRGRLEPLRRPRLTACERRASRTGRWSGEDWAGSPRFALPRVGRRRRHAALPRRREPHLDRGRAGVDAALRGGDGDLGNPRSRPRLHVGARARALARARPAGARNPDGPRGYDREEHDPGTVRALPGPAPGPRGTVREPPGGRDAGGPEPLPAGGAADDRQTRSTGDAQGGRARLLPDGAQPRSRPRPELRAGGRRPAARGVSVHLDRQPDPDDPRTDGGPSTTASRWPTRCSERPSPPCGARTGCCSSTWRSSSPCCGWPRCSWRGGPRPRSPPPSPAACCCSRPARATCSGSSRRCFNMFGVLGTLYWGFENRRRAWWLTALSGRAAGAAHVQQADVRRDRAASGRRLPAAAAVADGRPSGSPASPGTLALLSAMSLGWTGQLLPYLGSDVRAAGPRLRAGGLAGERSSRRGGSPKARPRPPAKRRPRSRSPSRRPATRSPGSSAFPRQSFGEVVENAGYFLVGRHAGLLPYHPFAALAFGLFLFSGRRDRDRWLLVLGLAAIAGYFLLFIGWNWQGGGGFIGNRYFVSVMPAFLFLVPGRIPPWTLPAGGARRRPVQPARWCLRPSASPCPHRRSRRTPATRRCATCRSSSRCATYPATSGGASRACGSWVVPTGCWNAAAPGGSPLAVRASCSSSPGTGTTA